MRDPKIAKEVVAVEMTIDRLDADTKRMIEPMKKKGYTLVAQISSEPGNEDFGDPIFFKTANELSEFLREFPGYKKAKSKWVLNI
jgi:hypothetical protein